VTRKCPPPLARLLARSCGDYCCVMLCEMTAEYGPLEIMSVTQWRNLTREQSHGKACGRAWYFRPTGRARRPSAVRHGKACGRAWYFRRCRTRRPVACRRHGKACGRAWYFRHERLSKEIAFWTDGKACGRAWYFRRFGTATADDVRDVVWQSLREGFVLSTEHMDHLAGGRNQFTFSWE